MKLTWQVHPKNICSCLNWSEREENCHVNLTWEVHPINIVAWIDLNVKKKNCYVNLTWLDRSILTIWKYLKMKREKTDLILWISPVGDVQLCSWKLVLTVVGHGGHLQEHGSICIWHIFHRNVFYTYFTHKSMYFLHVLHGLVKLPCSGWSRVSSCSD